jgi:hypothetical protein
MQLGRGSVGAGATIRATRPAVRRWTVSCWSVSASSRPQEDEAPALAPVSQEVGSSRVRQGCSASVQHVPGSSRYPGGVEAVTLVGVVGSDRVLLGNSWTKSPDSDFEIWWVSIILREYSNKWPKSCPGEAKDFRRRIIAIEDEIRP